MTRISAPAANRGLQARAHVPLSGPVAEINELLAKKPNASIAVVQGSFDWFHNGHLALVSAVASAKDQNGKPYDKVIVMPTWSYDRKPYLRNAFARRVDLARAAIETRPELTGRVVVSEAMFADGGKKNALPSGPAQMMRSLCESYGQARFAYCLGNDSFDDSADHSRWPGFEYVEKSPRIRLLAVERGGHALKSQRRADGIVKGESVKISSSEIRQALYEGDLESIANRVPPSTLQRLKEEQGRIEERRSTGQVMMGLEKPSLESFEALRSKVPAGAVDLLDMVDMHSVPEDMRQHLANVQALVNHSARQVETMTFRVADRQMAKEKGYSEKVMLAGRMGNSRPAKSFLHKPSADPATARLTEMTSVLANLFGVPTPIATVHAFVRPKDPREHKIGVSVEMIEAVVEANNYDVRKASPKVLEQLVLTRWFNDLLGNLDVWAGQILVPQDRKKRYKDMVAIDFDEAFNRMPAEKLFDALINHFGLPPSKVSMGDCKWRDRTFRFGDPVGWAPEQFDGHMGYYAQIWKGYLKGDLDVDLDRVKERVRFAAQVPREAVLNCMQRFIEVSAGSGKGGEGDTVYLPAANPPHVSRADFERLFVQRIQDSVEQFCGFLDELKAARNDPDSRLAKFYANLKERPY